MFFLRALALFGILALLFVVGFSFRDLARKRLPSKETMGSLIGQQQNVAPQKLFRENFDHILTSFAKPVEKNKLKYAGLTGLMSSLGDPHTMFLEPRISKEFKIETSANFAGVGARLGPDALGARVANVFEDGPAIKAGLKAGDLITAVDGVQVGGWHVNDIVDKVRGPEKTPVRLTITRDKVAQPITLKIVRARIVVPTVTSKILPSSKIGYIDVASFAEPTTEQFQSALVKLDSQKVDGIVIDLRGNPGGLLQTAVEMLSLFLDQKTAITMRTREGGDRVVRTLGGFKMKFNYPITILVNADSASAAEIMAGALQDYKLATLVGEHTYGKASVQEIFPLTDGSSAKVTIARYFLPNGTDIGRKVDDDGQYVSGGIKVDVEVELQDSPAPVIGDPKADSQLAKAMEVIMQKRGKKTVQLESDPMARALRFERFIA